MFYPLSIVIPHSLYWTNNNRFMSYDMNSRVIKKYDFNVAYYFRDITIYQVNYVTVNRV